MLMTGNVTVACMKDWLERRLSLMMTLRLAEGPGCSRRSQLLCVLQAVHGIGKVLAPLLCGVGEEKKERRVRLRPSLAVSVAHAPY